MGIDNFSFFEAYFKDEILNPTGDTQICCPFPHQNGNLTYYETNPSAGVNLEKKVFHCFTCQRSYSETSFAAEVLGGSYSDATKIVKAINKSSSIESWKYAESNLELNDDIKNLLINKLQLNIKTIKEMHIGYRGGGEESITIPIIVYDRIVDLVTYRPGKHPKYIRKTDSISGIPCPFDLWIQSEASKPTLICAGEKDMLIARSKGFNAISFTGGEANTPTMFLKFFKDRPVFIIYDNDETGRLGAQKLALALKNHTKSTHIVDLSPVCKEKGEDLWDFFCKYNKTKQDLINILNNTKKFSEEEAIRIKNQIYPTIKLNEATKPQNLHKVLKSKIQVIATIENIYSATSYISMSKVTANNEHDTLNIGDVRTWELNDTNYKELFYMIDSNLKEKAIEKYIKTNLLHIPEKEKGLNIDSRLTTTVYKCTVTDTLDTGSTDSSLEFIAYSLNNKLENGKKYIATYKLVPHPQDGQKLIMVIKDVEESDDFLTTFQVTESVKQSLRKFQVTTTVEDKIKELINLAKGIVKADYNETLLKVVDIWFHSALQFSVGSMKDIRGYIDGLIVGESRIGKSSTVAALQEMYDVGRIVSLAGASATPAGLIGGSSKVAGGAFQTRAGIIPQNNKGGIIFEELVKCRADLIKELTDIRSSNQVRIARVNGFTELPAYVRMLTLTNSKTHDGIPKPINSYANGISILTDIIGTPEDIARYDLIAIFGFEATKEIDPFYEPPEPLPKIDYQNRIRWVWSRKQENIYISKSIYQYTVQMANKLNKDYGTFINIFGVEAWKKILRIAVAIAGYVCSTDENFQDIIVNEDHVNEAIKLMLELYDNPTFKLKEYVEEEKINNQFDNADKETMQEIWKTCPTLIDYLIKYPECNRSNLQLISGLSNDDFGKIIYKLVLRHLIKIEKTSIFITNKFNKAFREIDKDVEINREVVFKFDD